MRGSGRVGREAAPPDGALATSLCDKVRKAVKELPLRFCGAKGLCVEAVHSVRVSELRES